MKINIEIWVPNEYNPTVKAYLDATTDKVFGSMNNSLLSMFGESVKVGVNDDVNAQHSKMVDIALGFDEDPPLSAIFEFINETEKALGDTYKIPKEMFLYKITRVEKVINENLN